jgi:MFS transporter, DHA1 family, multidrug resistance protein
MSYLGIVPTLSGLPTGAGIMTIFLQALNYLIDAYLVVAASAIAANTFLRSFFGAGSPLFATAMFNNLGVDLGWEFTWIFGSSVFANPLLVLYFWRKVEEE